MSGSKRRGHLQLWSYNYSPEPTGIGPVSRILAHELRSRGYSIDVVAAHPHYPEPKWGKKAIPYREERDGISVLRLPLWVGRATAAERYRQELTFMAAQTAAIPALGSPDLAIIVSPSFPALLPAVINARLRRIPWILWLHDILPDGAVSTGLVDSGAVLGLSRGLEKLAYREADRIVVLSPPFVRNLVAKGISDDKIELIYDPATREPEEPRPPRAAGTARNTLRILTMGNIGRSQGLVELVRAFERSGAVPDDLDVRLVITGNGVAAEDCRREIRTDRVQMLGFVDSDRLEDELRAADVGLVSQQHEGSEFNIPSKIMNFMAYALPVLAAVNPASEVARIVEHAQAGWVVDSSSPEAFARQVIAIAADPAGTATAAEASLRYAREHFTTRAFGDAFERCIEATLSTSASPSGSPAAAR